MEAEREQNTAVDNVGAESNIVPDLPAVKGAHLIVFWGIARKQVLVFING